MLSEKNILLLTPGPTKIPERVKNSSSEATIHHRSESFSVILSELLENLKPLFGTKKTILPVHTTGRGAMESSISNLLNEEDHILSICNGKFGDMFANIAENYNCKVTRMYTNWEEEVSLPEIKEYISKNPDLKAVTIVHSDTSSGILNPVEEVAKVLDEKNILLIVDGISSIGNVKFEFDKWGVDVAITASQKCLMSYPGVSFVALSEKAWKFQKTSKLPYFYTNFKSIYNSVSKEYPETPGTTPVSLMVAVSEAVKMIHEEGFENTIQRIFYLRKELINEMIKLGFLQYPLNVVSKSPTVSLFKVPKGINVDQLQKELLNRFNIYIAKGLGEYSQSIIRIAHMGDIRKKDLDLLIYALKILKNEKEVVL